MPRQTLIIVGSAAMCVGLSALDMSITTIAAPRIVASLRGPITQVALIFATYLGAAVLILPWSGVLADRWSSPGVLIGGLALFGVGSVGCLIAPNFLVFLLSRTVQGLGGGVLMVLPMTIIGQRYAPNERPRWQGILAAAYGLATLVGPPLGGWITTVFGWRWIFGLNLPLTAIALVGGSGIPSHRGSSGESPHWTNLVLFSGIVGFILLLTTRHWSAMEYGVFIVGLLILGVPFVQQVRNRQSSLWPQELEESLIISRGFLLMFLIAASIEMGAVYSPLLFQRIFLITPQQTGIWLIPMSLVAILASLWSGKWMTETGLYRRLLIGAQFIMVFGLMLATLSLVTHILGILEISTLLFGLGLGLQQPILAVVIQAATPDTYIGRMSSLLPLVWNVGALVGILISSFALALFHGLWGWVTLYLMASAILLLTVGIAIRLPYRSILDVTSHSENASGGYSV